MIKKSCTIRVDHRRLHAFQPTNHPNVILLGRLYGIDLIRPILISSPNGCGLIKGDIIPDAIGSCEAHDIEYAIGSPKDVAAQLRAISDTGLRDGTTAARRWVGWIYYWPVRLFGGLIWRSDANPDAWRVRLGLSLVDATAIYARMRMLANAGNS